MNRILNHRRAPIAAAVIAMAAVLLAVACDNLPIIGNPDPCDRSQAMRDALERETGRDCDIITGDDLADVRNLSVSGPLQRSDFAGLENLQALSWSGLTELPSWAFDGLTRLQHLSLRGSYITGLPPSLRGNYLMELPPALRGNYLTELPSGVFDDLTNLQHLDLQGNNLMVLPPGAFDNLNNLQTLYLEGNPGDPFDIDIGICNRTPSARYILEQEIERNCASITEVDLINITRLNFSGNELSELPPGIFDGLTNLKALSLWNNDLSELPPGVFDDLTNLRDLHLQSNNLTELPPGVFDGLTNLQKLDLRYNPGAPFTVTLPNANLDCRGCNVVRQ